MVWCPEANIFRGVDIDENWEGSAFSSDSVDTFIIVLGEKVNVRDSFCVPVLVGGRKQGWIFEGTKVIYER